MQGGPEYPVLGGVENKKGAGVSQGAPFGQSFPYSNQGTLAVSPKPDFISSVTVVHAPELRPGQIFPSFISSATVVRAPALVLTGQQTTVTVAGTYQWLCPPGIVQVYVEVIGGGGGGADGSFSLSGGGGGGGGAYALKTAIPVTPGTLYTFIVGAAGVRDPNTGTTGGDSSFTGDSSTQVLAKGGSGGVRAPAAGGPGGSAASSTGDTKFSGGDGFTQSGSGNAGGGGASGNRLATGASSTSRLGAAGANGGGSGGNGGVSAGGNGVAGSSPGGGGGGGGTIGSGANGADGSVEITTAIVNQFIVSKTIVYTPGTKANLLLPFISSHTTLHAPSLQSSFAAPFISSHTVAHAPSLIYSAGPLFIASHTVVYTPIVTSVLVLPAFISSNTLVYPIVASHTFTGDAVSQVALETLILPSPDARLSQLTLEVIMPRQGFHIRSRV